METILLKPHNPFTKTVYSGENVFRLATASTCEEWATFLQWHQHGFKVKKGERGTIITRFIREDKKNNTTGKITEVESVRNYIVFNRTQVEEKEEHDV